MAHYRAVMATTIDCEGCKYDSPEECTSEEGCIAFIRQKTPDNHKESYTPENAEDLIAEILSRARRK